MATSEPADEEDRPSFSLELEFSTTENEPKIVNKENKQGRRHRVSELLRPVYTGDFCRATQCNFCRAKVATSISHV